MQTDIGTRIQKMAEARINQATEKYFKTLHEEVLNAGTIEQAAAAAGVNLKTIDADLADLTEAARLSHLAAPLFQLRKAVGLARAKVEGLKKELKDTTERLTAAIDGALKDLRIAEEPASEACKAAEKLEAMHRARPELLPRDKAPQIVKLLMEYNELVLAASKADNNFGETRQRRILCQDRKGALKIKVERFGDHDQADAKQAREALDAATRELRELEDAETQAEAEAAKTKSAAENAKYRTA